MKFMFEPLVDGTVEMLCKKIKQNPFLRIWRHCPAWNRSSAGGKHTCRTLQIGLFHGHPFKKLLQCKEFANLDSINQTFKDGIADIRNMKLSFLKSEEFFLQTR